MSNFQTSEAEEILIEKTRISANHMQQLHKVITELNKKLPIMVRRAIIMSSVSGFISGAIAASVITYMVTK